MCTRASKFILPRPAQDIEIRQVDPNNPNAYYPPGTVITCTAGHKVLEIGEALHHNELIQVRHFKRSYPFQSMPVRGRAAGTCVCGRPYYNGTTHRGMLHTANGWKA